MSNLTSVDEAARALRGDEFRPKKMTIVAWSGSLDKAWPTLILATTAAASGMDVAVFFTFWGLRILQKNNKRLTGRNWKQRMLSIFNRGGAEHPRLFPPNMGGGGAMMMRQPPRRDKDPQPAQALPPAPE